MSAMERTTWFTVGLLLYWLLSDAIQKHGALLEWLKYHGGAQ